MKSKICSFKLPITILFGGQFSDVITTVFGISSVGTLIEANPIVAICYSIYGACGFLLLRVIVLSSICALVFTGYKFGFYKEMAVICIVLGLVSAVVALHNINVMMAWGLL